MELCQRVLRKQSMQVIGSNSIRVLTIKLTSESFHSKIDGWLELSRCYKRYNLLDQAVDLRLIICVNSFDVIICFLACVTHPVPEIV